MVTPANSVRIPSNRSYEDDQKENGSASQKTLHTVREIARHVVTGESYEKRPSQENWKDSRAYKILTKEAPEEMIEQVRKVINGEISLKEIEGRITSQSAYQYLAAAKVVDFESSGSEKSTYEIRKLALLRSAPEKNGRAEINMLNAFSMPPLNADNCDVVLLNELDNNHPVVKNAKDRDERDHHLKRIYTYSQYEARLLPELASVIEDVVTDRVLSMKETAKSLPKETVVVFKGPSGAGKSHALKQLMSHYKQTQALDEVVQSTDIIKSDIGRRTGNVFKMQHLHLLGLSTFKMLSESIKATYPKLSTVQEGWFHNAISINQLFKDLNAANHKLEMHDFDGDYTALCLRVLSRLDDPNSPKPPMNQVDEAFKATRESRALLLKSLRETDTYQFRFVDVDGVINDKLDPQSIPSSPEKVNEEVANGKKMVINEKHAEIFGKFLNQFVGMTLAEAFEKARAM
jgi:hypothetical protein